MLGLDSRAAAEQQAAQRVRRLNRPAFEIDR